MPFIISLSCIHLGLAVEEAFAAATYFSSKALNLEEKVGSITIGRQADLIVWDVDHLMEIPYNVTDLAIKMVIKNGKAIDWRR
jgi:imidazolonepropionase